MTNFIEDCRQTLQENGLAPTDLITDGALHRCPTTDKPQGKDGAYIVHIDEPCSLWWCNHRTGQSGTHTAKSEGSMTTAERQAFNARAKAEREQREADRQARNLESAQKAQDILSNAQRATDDHPYLQKKQVPSLGLYLGRDNALIVPVMDNGGKVVSLQFIPPDGKGKRFLSGGKMAGGFFPIPAKDGSKDSPLCIAEGYATAASIYGATGYACLVPFNAGNIEAVAKMARQRYPNRTIIICADNDHSKSDNAGIAKATTAAQTINALLAIPPIIEGSKATDFNDLHIAQGLEAVKACIDSATNALKKKKSKANEERGYYFEQRKSGLWHIQTKDDGDNQETWLCSPIDVLGQTRDHISNSWGIFLEWHDQDNIKHTWAMPKALLVGRDVSAWLMRLVDEGLRIAPSTAAKNKLALYLATHDTTERILCVNTTGWHGEKYVLPDTTIENVFTPIQNQVGQVGQVGQPNNNNNLANENPSDLQKTKVGQVGQRVVLQTYTARNPYTLNGTLEAWQSTIGQWARGNSRLMLAISAALSATLLEPTGTENGGFNFVGGSSTGKTTTLTAAATVYGKGSSQGGYIQSWRATDNGLEGISCLHNDACLCLDELGQAPARVAKEATYMLANGAGKSRARQDGTARQAKSWRTLILSTGEKTIAEKIAEDGGKVQAGQGVRLVDIPADAGAGLGIFENLHGFESPRSFADAIKHEATTNYGHLARAFIAKFLQHPESKDEILNFLANGVALLSDSENIDGQVQRVAKRFLLAASAGETAAEWGLLPWQQGEALQAAKSCFNAWVNWRGGVDAHEDKATLEQIMLFIEQHGKSRFQDLDKTHDAPCINRVGFRSATNNGIEFYILPQSFKAEICKGINATRAAKLLADKGILLRGDGNNLTRRPPQALPDFGRKRCYVLSIGEADYVA